MNASDARKLIGKRVYWEEPVDWAGCSITRNAVFLEVSGRNVRTRSNDWLWLPKMKFVKAEDCAP